MRRNLTKEESDFIMHLLKGCPNNNSIINELATIQVEEMNDGGMGSLKFIPNHIVKKKFGKQLCEASFLDADEVPISFAINLDTDGNLFELDVFKADSSPLIKLPLPPYKELL